MRVEGLSLIYAESVGNRSKAKTAVSGVAAHDRSNQPHTSARELSQRRAIYLIAECDTEDDVPDVLRV
jgi:hypothetical protein